MLSAFHARGRTKPPSIFPTSIVPVPVVTTGSSAAKARNSSSSSASNTPRPHEPLPARTPPPKPPGAATVEHRTEDHHLARLDPGSPILGMTRHDLALLVAHVQRERRTGRLEPEYEGAHELSMPSS